MDASWRSDSGNSPMCRSVCEMLQESSEEEDGGDGSGGNLTYVQQLQRILGDETAEYFLHPPPMEFHISASLQSILDQMEDTPGAEELWRILQEKSKQKLKEEYGEPISQEEINLLRNFAQRPAMQKVSRKRRQLIYIRQLLESHQDQTDLLLSSNPFPDMNDDQGMEGSTRFLHQIS
ncbi:coiled-coil domain-containing protein 71 isoform X3 [Phyllobates terribilis]|uniref:coiled-coil domain-containing protein 71 isoform X3 n=1 Tax=Phyllobates terribilis TaxID=111132 RepID=UPI003CCB51EC